MGQLRVKLFLPHDGTKSSLAQCRESRMTSVQIFVFDQASGRRETDRYWKPETPESDSLELSLTTLTGNKLIWAVVNAPRITSAPDSAQLSALTSSLADNAPDRLVMSGRVRNIPVTEMTPGTGSPVSEVLLPVRRLAAQVSLASVSADFRNTSLEGASFTVEALYLKNVVGKLQLDGSACAPGTEGLWYNLERESNVLAAPENIRALTLDSAPALPCAWYVYPNPGDVHPTRLVVKAHLGGTAISGAVDRDCYYVFTLPALERNHRYHISQIGITLEGKPDDNDDQLTEAGIAQASVHVQDWDGTTSLEYAL